MPRDPSDHNYVSIPDILSELNLHPIAWRLYVFYLQESNGSNQCSISMKQISSRIGVSKVTVLKYRKILEDAHLVKVVHKKTPDGNQDVSLVVLEVI